MKFRFLFLLTLTTLSGCKTLFNNTTHNQAKQPNLSVDHLSEEAVAAREAIEQERLQLSKDCQAETDIVDPQAYSDVWQRIKSQLFMNVPDKQRIRAQKSWYLNHPNYMKRVSKRAEPYLFHVVEELEKNKLPLELALLPIVESAFDPFAYSHGRASGMWQFIPGTGKNFGLKQNWWYDGRRDVYLSTEAAIQFLTYLNKRFKGNWLHALAAYNSGEGNVRRAIRKNRKKGLPTDFWSLKLPRETQAYVPKLLALSQILSQAKKDDENWTPIANLPYFQRVSTGSQIDLSLVASLAEISMSEFYQLNPAYNQWATSPQGPHFVLLPVDKVETFNQNLAEIPPSQRISYKRYTIKKGDSLGKIARRFSTTVSMLKKNNNIKGHSIRAGKSLLIPVASKARDKYHKSSQQRLLASQNKTHKGKKVTIKVASGDSMWDLSRKYKVNIRQLAKWNNMAPTDPLKIGQKLVVWTKSPQHRVASLSNTTGKTKKIHYKVRNGDSLARIASKFNLNLNKVKQWNAKYTSRKYLQPGDSLTLYVDITRQY